MGVRERRFWKNRSVLVTGGAGFIGYALSSRLTKLGAHVTVLDVKSSLPRFSLGSLDARKKISYIRGSVTSKKTVDRVLKQKKIKTIFHLAAEAIVKRANEHPARTLEANAKGTWILLEAARNARSVCEIVVASSDKAYGAHDRLPYREGAALRGLNPYDCSKSCTDLIAQMYAHAFHLPVTIARCGNVYGPGDTHWTRLVPDAFRSAAANRVLDIRSDGTFRRDWIYIDDIVEAYLVLGRETREHIGEAFNFGNNKPLSVLQVLSHIQKVAPSLRYEILDIAKNEIRNQYLDSRKAARALRWKARVSFKGGIEKTAAWYNTYFS
ncbi:SDR family NAD(P)-dependent oxidoreductase [Candidatus Kaiserbacteria bacterium]|nr:SDR family NAD(P)-dependent oxidoreductase [Candidatus Kaiserbacteria bacterium]